MRSSGERELNSREILELWPPTESNANHRPPPTDHPTILEGYVATIDLDLRPDQAQPLWFGFPLPVRQELRLLGVRPPPITEMMALPVYKAGPAPPSPGMVTPAKPKARRAGWVD